VERLVSKKIVLGIERLINERLDLIRGARVGLICNQASVDHSLNHAADLFRHGKGIELTALFGPQHGIRGDVQDNMIETAHTIDKATGVPVFSLYSETREPTEEMLRDVDVVVFDLQDIGCRIYTFIYTLANCMRAAGRLGKRVVVCDRPNPISGELVEGNVLEPEFASFVGQFPIATRHGMTVGELARMFVGQFEIKCDIEVVEVKGWERDDWLDQTDSPWVIPSPNMPTLDTATVFPGTVHLEGTQISEGRGTTRPFELIGAPYVDGAELALKLNGLDLPGVHFRPCDFRPTFQKHGETTCGGVQIHVIDRQVFQPVITGVAVVKVIYELWPDEFRWKEPPYEYVFDKNPFDVIAGSGSMRKQIEENASLGDIKSSWKLKLDEFELQRQGFLIY
jgi:uncharacterized protein YbbC (DUF1343 family)